MTEVLSEDYISEEDLLKFEDKYYKESKAGTLSTTTKFEYGWCLVRTQYKEDIRKGIKLLESLCDSKTDQRDFLFFIAFGYYKLGDFDTSLRYTKRILTIEPNNHQAKDLELSIEKKMKSEGLLGMAMVGSAAAVISGIILGAIFAKKGGGT